MWENPFLEVFLKNILMAATLTACQLACPTSCLAHRSPACPNNSQIPGRNGPLEECGEHAVKRTGSPGRMETIPCDGENDLEPFWASESGSFSSVEKNSLLTVLFFNRDEWR